MRKQCIIIMGSEKDELHVSKITKELKNLKIPYKKIVASAHKQTKKLLTLVKKYNKDKAKICYITVAGRSNALSGVVAANSVHPVIACPPFKNKYDYLINIHSTLQMPSKVPVLTVLDPSNAALAAQRILNN